MMVQQATNPTAYQNLTQQLFTQAASSFERVNSVLVELVSNMLRQEQGIPPVTEEQLPYIPVHPVDSTMLGLSGFTRNILQCNRSITEID